MTCHHCIETTRAEDYWGETRGEGGEGGEEGEGGTRVRQRIRYEKKIGNYTYMGVIHIPVVTSMYMIVYIHCRYIYTMYLAVQWKMRVPG